MFDSTYAKFGDVTFENAESVNDTTYRTKVPITTNFKLNQKLTNPNRCSKRSMTAISFCIEGADHD
jgi:hypothetical protein